ncbi:MAG: UDP-N-acetylmuramate dehydrogenase [Candidatus Solibacter usitatus]|nr:UDP-N-acetylmuramate dehydrogenase [Candidatus Solibacter usitatus]
MPAAKPALDFFPAGLHVQQNVPLSQYTRFGIGGPAAVFVETSHQSEFCDALRAAQQSGMNWMVIGQGSNLIVADAGFDGVVLRYTASGIRACEGGLCIEAGAVLQDVVDQSIARGFAGLHTMTGIPGWVGAAIYGNAGAYGHSIHEFVHAVRFTTGVSVREFNNGECGFAYRESVFKKHKDWILLSAELRLPQSEAVELRRKADEIRAIRDAKYPPSMRCAGSIFKNLILTELPQAVRDTVPRGLVKEGKLPAAWILEQVGAKGMRRGDIQVAAYHANLIYNDGAGTAADLRAVIDDLKSRVEARFGFSLEEEVQYAGF